MFVVQCSCGAKSDIKLSDIIRNVGKRNDVIVEGEVDIVIGDYELINVYCSRCGLELNKKEENV